MKTEAQSIFINDTDKAKLAEIFGGIVENIQKNLLSSRLKSQNFSGDIKAGSVQFKRFENSESQVYGTARTAQKGKNLIAPPITVNIDVNREIVEEVETSDIDKFGVAGLIERRKSNHLNSLARELETAFFAAAKVGAVNFTPTASIASDQLEDAIVALETTKNKYINGIERNLIVAVLSPNFYSELRSYFDKLPTNKVDVSEESVTYFHGVSVYPSIYLPDGVKFNLLAKETIAQPISIYPYGAEKIPLSNAVAVELFYDYGTKLLAPELSLYCNE